MNAICLVVDGWHANFLGCFGNSWIATPELDALACEGFVFDNAWLDSPDQGHLYRALWQGHHALGAPAAGSQFSLPLALRAAGYHTALLTDDPRVESLELCGGFADTMLLEPRDAPAACDSEEETHTGRLIALGLDWFHTTREPFLLWIHTRGLLGPWDAPREYRQRYAAEGDPPPPELLLPPARHLGPNPDPDELLGYRQCYAAQVSVLDVAVGWLAEAHRSSALGQRTLLAVMGARGFPLGIHGQVGFPTGGRVPLYGDVLHVPWLWKFPEGTGAAARSGALVQPPDVCATLVDWLGLRGAVASGAATESQGRVAVPARVHGGRSVLPIVRDEQDAIRDRACTIGTGGQTAIRTPGWFCRFLQPAGSELSPAELYVKPDDLWEVNEVADRCPEIVEALRRALAAFEATCRQDESADPPPLDELLR